MKETEKQAGAELSQAQSSLGELVLFLIIDDDMFNCMFWFHVLHAPPCIGHELAFTAIIAISLSF